MLVMGFVLFMVGVTTRNTALLAAGVFCIIVGA